MVYMQLIPYNDPLAPLFIRNSLFSFLPNEIQKLTVLCIGSNRINGDSLGPFVGTLLQDAFPQHVTVIGSLQNPVDAPHLEKAVAQLDERSGNFLVSVDSIIGSKEHVHTIAIRQGALRPGSGLGKNLPAVGDASIMGVVLEESDNPFHALSYTNLNIVYQMARSIATGIALAARQHFGYEAHLPLLSG
ncbi:MAG: spore protease YyaC [Ectobacillus sp.]